MVCHNISKNKKEGFHWITGPPCKNTNWEVGDRTPLVRVSITGIQQVIWRVP